MEIAFLYEEGTLRYSFPSSDRLRGLGGGYFLRRAGIRRGLKGRFQFSFI